MNYFNKNLNYLLKEQKLKKIELSKRLNITRQAINDWTINSVYPIYDNLIKLSEILNITIDDLLKKDMELNFNSKEDDDINFRQNLKRLRSEKNLSQRELAEALSLNIETIKRLEQPKQKTIDFKVLKKIVTFFNCSYDDLFK